MRSSATHTSPPPRRRCTSMVTFAGYCSRHTLKLATPSNRSPDCGNSSTAWGSYIRWETSRSVVSCSRYCTTRACRAASSMAAACSTGRPLSEEVAGHPEVAGVAPGEHDAAAVVAGQRHSPLEGHDAVGTQRLLHAAPVPVPECVDGDATPT